MPLTQSLFSLIPLMNGDFYITFVIIFMAPFGSFNSSLREKKLCIFSNQTALGSWLFFSYVAVYTQMPANWSLCDSVSSSHKPAIHREVVSGWTLLHGLSISTGTTCLDCAYKSSWVFSTFSQFSIWKTD